MVYLVKRVNLCNSFTDLTRSCTDSFWTREARSLSYTFAQAKPSNSSLVEGREDQWHVALLLLDIA